MKNFNTIARMFAAIALTVIVAACGGGGGGGSGGGVPIFPPVGGGTTEPTPVTTSIGGTAAVGSPIVGASVLMRCASGEEFTATTANNGWWTTSALKPASFPCVIKLSGGTVNGEPFKGSLYSVASAEGTSNITPLTDLVVAVLSGQDPATWFDAATKGSLTGAITPTSLQEAVGKVKVSLKSLGLPVVFPADFDPILTRFEAQKNDVADGLLESYTVALYASGLTQAQVASNTIVGTELTKSRQDLIAFTTPGLNTIKAYASENLDGKTGMSIADNFRGDYALTAERNNQNDLINVKSDKFVANYSAIGNKIGQLCVAGKGGVNDKQVSQYTYVAADLQEVPFTDLIGKSFSEYEDCQLGAVTTFRQDGSFVVMDLNGQTGDPRLDYSNAFLPNGYLDIFNGAVVKGKAYKTKTAQGWDVYIYVLVSTAANNTDPVNKPELNGETDYVVLGFAVQPPLN